MLPEKLGITGEDFARGTLTFDGKELSDDEMSELQETRIRLAASCLSLCHNSQIAEVDSQWTAIGDLQTALVQYWATK